MQVKFFTFSSCAQVLNAIPLRLQTKNIFIQRQLQKSYTRLSTPLLALEE